MLVERADFLRFFYYILAWPLTNGYLSFWLPSRDIIPFVCNWAIHRFFCKQCLTFYQHLREKECTLFPYVRIWQLLSIWQKRVINGYHRQIAAREKCINPLKSKKPRFQLGTIISCTRCHLLDRCSLTVSYRWSGSPSEFPDLFRYLRLASKSYFFTKYFGPTPSTWK